MSILLTRWPRACRAQGWDKSDRDLRLRVISQAIGRWVKSMNDLNSTTDVDALYAHLGLLSDNLSLTQETLPVETMTVSAGRGHITKPATAGERRRILWLIRTHAEKLGGEPYIRAIAKCTSGLAQDWSTLEDLSTKSLHQLMTTLARCKSHKLRPPSAPSSPSDPSHPSDLSYPSDQSAETPAAELVSGPF
jgi:hypothetical protein